MNTTAIDITHWRTKTGDIPIKTMSDQHIQNSYYHSERQFIKCHNLTLDHADMVGDENNKLTKKYSDLTARWQTIMRALENEYDDRGHTLQSLSDGAEEGKFQILRNERLLRQ